MDRIFKYLKYETQNRIGFITLNRPEKRNALNADLVEELSLAFKKAETDDLVKVVVLKAEGKAFCAGADLEYLQQLSQNSYKENLEDSTNLKNLFYQIYTFKKIVVAQIKGHAIAGGAGLVTVVDFAFSVPEANFGFTEVKLGFIPALVLVFLIRKIGEGKAKELLLSGNLISAETAKSVGLISKVVAPEEIEEAVLKFATESVNHTSSLSVSLTKELVIKSQNSSIEDALNLACESNAKMRETEDFKKGVKAFLNKETPSWN
ncbi:MAG TPA: enoyl-CoA hydratase-related protein [Cytophagales bacterium]|nr:enoyl-CoA hydratase-related protein [Cytophagales bacterium]